MLKSYWPLPLLLALALLTSNLAIAQVPGGIYRGGVNPFNPKPTVSPYLNLLQRGNQGFPQYQTLVRPFLEQQAVNEYNSRQNQVMSRQINSLQSRSTGAGAAGGMRSTGHPTRYMNYSHYYNMR